MKISNRGEKLKNQRLKIYFIPTCSASSKVSGSFAPSVSGCVRIKMAEIIPIPPKSIEGIPVQYVISGGVKGDITEPIRPIIEEYPRKECLCLVGYNSEVNRYNEVNTAAIQNLPVKYKNKDRPNMLLGVKANAMQQIAHNMNPENKVTFRPTLSNTKTAVQQPGISTAQVAI